MLAAMPLLEANMPVFAYVAGVREEIRKQGQDDVKVMFMDVIKSASQRKM